VSIFLPNKGREEEEEEGGGGERERERALGARTLLLRGCVRECCLYKHYSLSRIYLSMKGTCYDVRYDFPHQFPHRPCAEYGPEAKNEHVLYLPMCLVDC
jgi:hypothetical protein